jgi:hypothetical protein
MLGHYINIQSDQVWDHWLTKPFRAGTYIPDHFGSGCGCLVGERERCVQGKYTEHIVNEERTVYDQEFHWNLRGRRRGRPYFTFYASPGYRFDALCARFGEARIQRAVRNRILTMKAHRELHDHTVSRQLSVVE